MSADQTGRLGQNFTSMGAVSFLLSPFQGNDFQVLERHSWAVGGTRLPQRGRGRIYNDKFSKVNVLRKGSSEVQSQEENGLKFSLAERNHKGCVS